MKLALYLGCTIPTDQYAYELSTREVFQELGIELVDLVGAGCCGIPHLRSINAKGWIYLSARILSLADKEGLDVLPLCNGCHLSLCEVRHYLETDPKLKESINSALSIEGLTYEGSVKIVHILDVLRMHMEKIQRSVTRPLKGLRLATHYGCHAIRPSTLGRPDDSEDPVIFEKLIEVLGADTENYPERLECCGSGLAISAGKTALAIAGGKLKAVQSYGFDGMIMICPFCMKIFDSRQRAISATVGDKGLSVPILYYTQLLGLAMGIDAEKLGLNLNLSPVDKVLSKLREG